MTTEPTTERLAFALVQAGAPPIMIRRAREGYYDDFKSPLAMPITQLVMDARHFKLTGIVERATAGDFDATPDESEAWLRSPEGQETLRSLGHRQPTRPRP